MFCSKLRENVGQGSELTVRDFLCRLIISDMFPASKSIQCTLADISDTSR